MCLVSGVSGGRLLLIPCMGVWTKPGCIKRSVKGLGRAAEVGVCIKRGEKRCSDMASDLSICQKNHVFIMICAVNVSKGLCRLIVKSDTNAIQMPLSSKHFCTGIYVRWSWF